jgi:hypothetical protein
LDIIKQVKSQLMPAYQQTPVLGSGPSQGQS